LNILAPIRGAFFLARRLMGRQHDAAGAARLSPFSVLLQRDYTGGTALPAGPISDVA